MFTSFNDSIQKAFAGAPAIPDFLKEQGEAQLETGRKLAAQTFEATLKTLDVVSNHARGSLERARDFAPRLNSAENFAEDTRKAASDQLSANAALFAEIAETAKTTQAKLFELFNPMAATQATEPKTRSRKAA